MKEKYVVVDSDMSGPICGKTSGFYPPPKSTCLRTEAIACPIAEKSSRYKGLVRCSVMSRCPSAIEVTARSRLGHGND